VIIVLIRLTVLITPDHFEHCLGRAHLARPDLSIPPLG
jgi:hypothetical protein